MSLAGGVLLWLGTHQIYPSQWVASMLGFAENAVYMSLAITLMILGISGLFGMMFGPSLYGWGSGFLRTNRKHLTTIEHKQPEEPESFDDAEPRNSLSAERISGLASIEQALALSDITEVGTWTPSLSYVEKDGDTVLDLVKADGHYKSLERYLEIDCRLEFILSNLPDSTKISITGLPFTINSDIHGIPIECKSRDTPNRTATFSGHVYGGSAQVRFHVTPHDLISGEVCYLQFKIVHINDDLNGFR